MLTVDFFVTLTGDYYLPHYFMSVAQMNTSLSESERSLEAM